MFRRRQSARTAAAFAALAAIALSAGALVPQRFAHAQHCGEEALYCNEQAPSRWEEAWQEERTPLPPLPSSEHLLAIDANRADARYEYLVDRTSISRGADDVMRYVVVIVSASGARNVFFEGIRCLTDEVKTYAYASGSGGFSRVTRSSWRPLAINGVRAYQEYLAGVILCDPNGYAWDAEKAAAALGRQFTAGGVRIHSFCRDCDSDMDERRND